MRNIESNYGNEENASKSSARILKEVFDSFLSKEVFNNIEIVHFKYEDSSGEGILILKLSEIVLVRIKTLKTPEENLMFYNLPLIAREI
jgi:hypothetical protein